MRELVLSDAEADAALDVAGAAAKRFVSVEDPAFGREAPVMAHDLPRSLRSALSDLRLTESTGTFLISGFSVDDAEIGPTPPRWRGREHANRLLADYFFFLVACLVGDPIGWATQQGGRLMHDLVPIGEHANEQLGSGSSAPLARHTEEAFHPYRADYLALLCMRNPDHVETTYATVDDVDVSTAKREMLSCERYLIRPDPSHLPSTSRSTSQAWPIWCAAAGSGSSACRRLPNRWQCCSATRGRRTCGSTRPS